MSSLEERFWDKVDRRGEDDCWEWQGTILNNGFGQIRESPQKIIVVHRYSYKLVHGSIPDKMDVYHFCQNKRCVNPKHLSIRTRSESNTNISRNRGESNPNAKLTSNDVSEIREMLDKGIAISIIARKFSVTPNLIYSIKEKRCWD